MFRPVSGLTDEDLVAQARELERLDDQAATTDPAELMRRVMPGYRHRPHLRIISDAVARIVDPDPARRVDRVLIRVPPQTGKTVTAVVGGALWWLANHPTDRVIIGSYNDRLAQDRGRDIKTLVETHGDRWGLRLARGATGVADWRLTTRGGVKSVGVGGGIVGSPGDFAIIDDPHKSREEADRLRMRDRVYRWMSGDITTRLSPGAPLILVMTPWHPDDLSSRVVIDQGRVEDGGRWLVIDMPALCTHPDRDPLGRVYGDPLPHPKIPVRDKAAAMRHWEDKRASTTLQDWSSQYQLDPKPTEGALLQRSLLRERRCYAEGSACHPCDNTPEKAAVAIDPSGGGRDTAGIIAGYRGSDKRLYISHDWSGVMDSDRWATKACQLAVEVDADRIVCEVNYGGDMVTLAIRTAWDVLRREELAAHGDNPSDPRYRDESRYARLCPRVVAVRARKNKLLRAEPVAQQWIVDRIRTAAYLPELEDEWCIAGGSEILTGRGMVPIEDVAIGDVVATRDGWKPVEWSGQTGVRDTVEIQTSDGLVLRCTPTHELWVMGKGWVRANQLEKSDRIPTCVQRSTPTSPLMVTATTSPLTATTNSPPQREPTLLTGSSTEQSGHSTTDRYQHGTSCAYETKTDLTTTSLISASSHMGRSVERSSTTGTRSTNIRTGTTKHPTQSTGNAYSTDPSGQMPMDRSRTKPTSITKTKTEPTTTYTTCEQSPRTSTFASTKAFPWERQPRTSKPSHVDAVTNGHARNPGTSRARSVESHFSRPESEHRSVLPDVANGTATVTSVRASGKTEPVYDLTVGDQHEYFANGLLVHNCTWQPDQSDSPGRIDASVYLAYALLTAPKASEGQVAGAPSGSMPVTSTSVLDRGSAPGGGGFSSGSFGPLG